MGRNNSVILVLALALFCACSGPNQDEAVLGSNDEIPSIELGISTSEHKDYWYRGTAEITSYKLHQARYGEVHEGNAVFIFVTEPFSSVYNTKADEFNTENVSVLKLNQTRDFTTGIYPYSIMTSSFFPFKAGDHSLKVSSTSQEWCGHSYMELGKKKHDYEIDINSYFEGESIRDIRMERGLLEDDVWSMIRIRKKLPQGKNKMYISMVSARLLHLGV
ncbi:MAG: hypothetical protein ACI837_001420 [Crocinitomicaceae bacterium]|jgi:hypothetical protein